MISSESGGALSYEAAWAMPYSRLLHFANDLSEYRQHSAAAARKAIEDAKR